MATSRKKAVSKTVRTVREDDYTPLENYCIALNEYFKALKVGGFDSATALTIMMDKGSHPEWLLPSLPNKIDPIEYIDDDEEDY
jgi:hypothetical protein